MSNELRKAKAIILATIQYQPITTIYNVIGFDNTCDEIFVIGSYYNEKSAEQCLINTMLIEEHMMDYIFQKNRFTCTMCQTRKVVYKNIVYYCKKCNTVVCNKCDDGERWCTCEDVYTKKNYYKKIKKQAKEHLFTGWHLTFRIEESDLQ